MTRRRRRRRLSPFRTFAIAGGLCALAVTLVLATGFHWPLLPAYLVGINLATVVLYGYDKRAAASGALRVPERALHIFAFLGGSPGAYLGQRLFHHKTVKRRFRFVFWALLIVQVSVALWACWYFRP